MSQSLLVHNWQLLLYKRFTITPTLDRREKKKVNDFIIKNVDGYGKLKQPTRNCFLVVREQSLIATLPQVVNIADYDYAKQAEDDFLIDKQQQLDEENECYIHYQVIATIKVL